MDRCDECGYEYAELSRTNLPLALRSGAADLAAMLTATSVDRLRAHPVADTWSALEYACHVRDVLRVQLERVDLALAEDEPEFVPMRRDERVTEDRYNDQDPSLVATELGDAADALANRLAHLDDRGWARTGIYNYPAPAARSVEWIGRHTIHEERHHLGDIDHLLRS
jgi:S-DNA-T family DNA segregation ATPase FtsK/SpoIIIE